MRLRSVPVGIYDGLMDISGRIRALLAGLPLESRPRDIFAVVAAQVLWGRTTRIRELYAWQGGRWVYESLVKTLIVRTNGLADGEMEELRRVADVQLREDITEPARLLWSHWLLTLGGNHHQGSTEDGGRKGELWKRAFALQGAGESPLHHLSSETLLDSFAYDELVALHAAYNSARMVGDTGMIDAVRRAVRWHVENTQPDHTTQEPWALAAFAALDESGTFAEQQLHDVAVGLRANAEWPADRAPVAVGLLADAVMTMDNLVL